jgi:UDP-2,3-diacylglucosamine pyrophosphatase LpxH
LKQGSYKLALRQFLPEIKVEEKFITTYKFQNKPIRLVITHGHQYDPIEIDGWGSAFLEIIVNVMEELFPEIDNINKSSLAEFLENSLQEVYKKQMGTIATISLNPLTAATALLGKNIKDKTALAIQIVHAYRQGILKSDEKFINEAKSLATGSRQYPEETVVAVLGHKHIARHVKFNDKTAYINTGCWVPEVVLDKAKRRFIIKPRADVAIFSSNRDPLDENQTLISCV